LYRNFLKKYKFYAQKRVVGTSESGDEPSGSIKSYKAGEVTDGSILRCMSFLCWITKGADTHLEYTIVIAFMQ
jgi:hypothetical protein